MSFEQNGCFTPAHAVLPNRLSSEPGTGGEMEAMGTLLGDAVRNGGVSGTAGNLWGMGRTKHFMFSDLPLLDQPPEGLRTQRGFMEAWWDTCQPGS